MIKITLNDKEYLINKKKLKFVLEKLKGSTVSDNEIFAVMKKFYLYDEYFLKNLNKI